MERIDIERLAQFVQKIAATKTLIETIGEHKAECCTPGEIAEDLDTQSNFLDNLILEARNLEKWHIKTVS